jgi:hypothetical protein
MVVKNTVPLVVLGLVALLVAATSGTLSPEGLYAQKVSQVTITVNESITVSDTPEVIPPVVINVDESIAIGDGPEARLPAVISVNETVAVSDAPELVLPTVIEVNESIAVSDGPAVATSIVTLPTPTPTPTPTPMPTLQPPTRVQSQLKSIAGNYAIVWNFNAATQIWEMYDPNSMVESNLTGLGKGRGYWIHISQAAKLVYGDKVYPLLAGWNLIGWLG